MRSAFRVERMVRNLTSKESSGVGMRVRNGLVIVRGFLGMVTVSLWRWVGGLGAGGDWMFE